VSHIPNYFCRFDLKKNAKDGFLLTISELRRNHAKRPENKCTFITLSPGLFSTCRGENTLLIQYCKIYSNKKCVCTQTPKNPYLEWWSFAKGCEL
jgi:hypothetical protein